MKSDDYFLVMLIAGVTMVILTTDSNSVFSGTAEKNNTSLQQPSQQEIDQSVSQTNENNRSMERFDLFLKQCANLIKSNDLSKLPACDAANQKFNTDIGKFFAENEAVIESIIYPYTLPPDIKSKLTLNSSNVIGSSDRSVIMEHSNELIGHMDKLPMLNEKCGAIRSYSKNYSAITECMVILKSLNDHFRDFNKNSQAEFDDVVVSPSGSLTSWPSQGGELKLLSSNSFLDDRGYYHVVGEIENVTPEPLTFVKATATFYDKNNSIVATDYSYTSPSDLRPGDKSPFEIILTPANIPINQIEHYKIKVSHD